MKNFDDIPTPESKECKHMTGVKLCYLCHSIDEGEKPVFHTGGSMVEVQVGVGLVNDFDQLLQNDVEKFIKGLGIEIPSHPFLELMAELRASIRTQVLEEVSARINQIPRTMFDEKMPWAYTEHEYMDTCKVFGVIHKLKQDGK